MPPLPVDYWPHRGLVRRPAPRPAIYANAGPMGWEAERELVPLDELQRGLPHHQHQHDMFPRAAPPSHHVPAMGLGGALLATNHPPVAWPAAARYHRAPARHAHLYDAPDEDPVPGRHIRHVARPPVWGGIFEAGGHLFRAMRHAAGYGPALAPGTAVEAALVVERLGEQLLDHIHAHAHAHAHGVAPLHPREPDYKPEYTHAGAPAPGFAFDFAPPVVEPGEKAAPIVIDDELATAKEPAPEATLVCAACHAPLLMEGGRATDELTRRRERVWALRCGHMFDGRCVQVMMRPAPEPELGLEPDLESNDMKVELVEPLVDRKGKGKAKEELADDIPIDLEPLVKDELGVPVDELLLKDGDFTSMTTPLDTLTADEPKPTARRKTKRKPGDTFDGIKLDPHIDPAGAAPTMRTRLRRRPGAPEVPEEEVHPPATPPPRARKTKAMPKRKTKGKGRPPQAERFEWACPIAACGRAHVSVRIEGEWVHDSKQGAIALFV